MYTKNIRELSSLTSLCILIMSLRPWCWIFSRNDVWIIFRNEESLGQIWVLERTNRSNHGRCSVKKGTLEIFGKFDWKTLVLESLLLKKDSKTGVFQWIFAKILRTPFLQNTSGGYFWRKKYLSCSHFKGNASYHTFEKFFGWFIFYWRYNRVIVCYI